MKVTDILGNMPDPTQFGIHGDVMEPEKAENGEIVVSTEMVQMVGTVDKLEADAIIDLISPPTKREGKHGHEPGLGDVSEIMTEASPRVEKKKRQVCISSRDVIVVIFTFCLKIFIYLFLKNCVKW